jgi:hypothetical protein
MVKRVFLITVAIAWAVSSAMAQTPIAKPTTVDVLVLPATGDPNTVAPVVPARSTVIGAIDAGGVFVPNAQCGRQPLPPGALPLVNPTQVEFDDPFSQGFKCVAPLPTGIPTGSGYRAVAIAIADNCTVDGALISPCPSARSDVAIPTFQVAPAMQAPVILTGVAVRP